MKKLMLAVGVVLALGWYALNRFSESPVGSPAVKPTERVAVAPVAATKADPGVTPPPALPPAKLARPAVVAPPPRVDPPTPTAGPIPLRDVLQPNNRYFDPLYGVAATYPTGWNVRDAMRWGVNNGENTVFFSPPEGSAAVPSMYYRRYADGPAFDMANPEATLRDMARQKEESRSGGGQNDYKNDPDSFVFRTVDGNPSLSYFATYTQGDRVHAEYFLRILGKTGYVMFFTRGPAKDVQAIIPAVFEMGGTVKPP